MVRGGSRVPARPAGLFLVCAGLAGVAAGCGDTAILLELTGNLTIPGDVNALQITVTVVGAGGVGQVFATEQIVLGPEDGMPFVLALAPGAAPLGAVTVNVNALKVEAGELTGVLVASGVTVSAFENQRVNRAVVMLSRAACVDDELENVDDGFYGAAVNVGSDGAQTNLELCAGDGIDRFNFVVPEGHQLHIAIDRFISADPGIESLQAIVRCQGWTDPLPITLALGPVAYGDFLLVDPTAALRTCILDLARPDGAPAARVSYGFVARLYEGSKIPTVCVDDVWDEPIGISVPAPALPPASGPDAVLCSGDDDSYALTGPVSHLISVDLVNLDGGIAAGVSGTLDCDPGYMRYPTSVFPIAGRTLPGINGTTTTCDLGLLNTEPFRLSYRAVVSSAIFEDCLPDLASPNDSPATAYDLNLAGLSETAGGRIDGLVVCSGPDDYFEFEYLGFLPSVIVTIHAPYYMNGDVDVCVMPLGIDGTTSPGPIGNNCSTGTTDQEVVTVVGVPGMRYSIAVDCWGGSCGNVYGLEIGVGF